jgi:transcriptional regulator with XRE-family HTH domain
MANIGVGDIENFESKIRFALLVIPPEEIIIAAMENHGKSITTVTLEAWRSGKNRPSKNKLKLVASILHIDTVDFYLDFENFADLLASKNKISTKYRDIYKKRVKDQLAGSLQLNAFSRFEPALIERLFYKINGFYIVYNYSISNIPRVHIALLHIKTLQVPFIGITVTSLRGGQYHHYTGTLFAVRSNLHIVMETEYDRHDEVVMIATNNPVDTAREVHFLNGVILAGSEDFVSHPTAARVFMEKLPKRYTRETALKMMSKIDTNNIPEEYHRLITNDLTKNNREYVLRAEQLSAAYMETLKQVSPVKQ